MAEYRMRKIDGVNVVVPIGERSKSFHGMLKLNDSAAEIFSMLEKDMSDDEIVKRLTDTYDVTPEQAQEDIGFVKRALSGLDEHEVRIEDVLERDGVFISTTAGMSMYPLLKNRRDNIVVRPVSGRLKKYDVPLYRRGSEYVLHRIIEVNEDSYVILGDNCINKEYGIKDSDIIGVAEGFYRRNKYVPVTSGLYKLYSRIWVASYPVRMFYKRSKSKAYRVYKAIKRRLVKIVANKK